MSRRGPRSYLLELLRRYRVRRERARFERERLPGALAAFSASYAAFRRTGAVPVDAGELLFHATWASGGTGPQDAARAAGEPFVADRYAALDDDLFAALDTNAAAAALATEGYFIWPQRLPAELVDEIARMLDHGPARPQGDAVAGRGDGVPDGSAPTWWMAPVDAIRSEGVQKVLSQRALAEVAGKYMGVDPMIMSLVTWKSYAWPVADALSAQQFHYDGDRPLFLKMFVYLTDVGPDNGPHTFVPRSHRGKPKRLLHGGRLTDGEVARHFHRRTWQTICGPKGTVFFAVTQGFHKGERVTAGTRSILQVNLSSDRYGYHAGDPIGGPDAVPVGMRDKVERLPRYFSELFRPE